MAILLGAFQDAAVEVGGENFGEECENIKLHGFILAFCGWWCKGMFK